MGWDHGSARVGGCLVPGWAAQVLSRLVLQETPQIGRLFKNQFLFVSVKS